MKSPRFSRVSSLPVVSFSAALVLSGCAAGNRSGELEREVGRLKSELQDLRSIQADHSARLDEMKSQLGSLGGKFDELQFSAQGKTQQLEQQLRVMSSRVPPPPGVPEDLLNSDDAAIARLTGPAAELFRSSLIELRNGNFAGAQSGLSRFVQENPSTGFTDNALLWLGVCAEKQNQPNQAVMHYSDVFKRFPAEDSVAPALYRLAEVFLATDSKQEATLALQKLVDEHGSTPYGARGRDLLASLQPKKKKR